MLNDTVTKSMPVVVIDRFEVVNIDHQQSRQEWFGCFAGKEFFAVFDQR